MSGRAQLFDALFRPRAVALVGASSDPAKNTARPQRFLQAHGASTVVYPVNPSRSEVLGRRAYPSVAVLPDGVDHALVMTPARSVPGVIADCVARGVAVATIYSDGYAESGEAGVERQAALREQARAGAIRILGPNSMGVVSVPERLPLTVNAALEAPALVTGRTALLSQSGTMIGAMLSRAQARGLGFSRMVSLGNEADLGAAELLDLLCEDDATDVVALFLETIRDPAALGAAARRAYAAGKRVVAYKLGRSEAGRALARSHSGAIAGSAAAASAFFAEHAILEVGVLETLLEIPLLLAGREPRDVGRKVAVITTTGGGAATVADRLGALGVELAGTSSVVAEVLREEGVTPGSGPIIDLTMAGARPGVYARALDALITAHDSDTIVAVVGSSAQFHPEIAVRAIADATAGGHAALVAFALPEAPEALDALARAGVAAFRTPESCAEAVRALLAWRAPRIGPQLRASPGVLALVAGARGAWTEQAAGALVEALGIERPAGVVLAPGAAVPALPWPVAVKALGAGLEHKTELGAVVLDVADEAQLVAAVAAIGERLERALPGRAPGPVLVQPMLRGVAEVLVAYRRDPGAGPTITVGVGGVLAELHGGATVHAAPVTVAEAHAMIDAVPPLAVVSGYRGLPAGDRDALAAAVAALSALAAPGLEAVQEAEINPLLVLLRGQGVVALDALVVAETEPNSNIDEGGVA